MQLKEGELKEALDLILNLDPRPGNSVIQSESQYVIPDVAVSKRHGKWVVELNPDAMPRIRINDTYAAMARNARNSSDSQFIRSHLQEAKWFIKSLESRNETLLKVANCIVQQQQDFFEYGEEAMKRLEEESKDKEKAKKDKLPEFGSDKDFQLNQAINQLRGVTVLASKSKTERPEAKKEE